MMTEQMKPSSIAWIEDIPVRWNKSKVKYLFNVINGSTPESSDFDCWDGLINWITPADMNNTGTIHNGERTITRYGYNSCGTTLLPIGSIVISSRAPIGKINLTTGELCTNQGCKSLVRDLDNRYFYYLILAGQEQLILLGRGTTFLELGTYDLNGFDIIVPSSKEQQNIADFLDKQCAEIDSIVTDIEKQIELLQKYRKALITETVTNGLDKSAPMKDSGIEWIGSIPEHWDDITHDYDQRYCIRFIKAENIQDGRLNADPEFFIDSFAHSQLKRSILNKNDLLFVIAGATIGKVAVMDESFCPCNTNQAVCFIRYEFKYQKCIEYFKYALQSSVVSEVIKLLTVQAAQPNLSMGNISNIKVPLPSSKEMIYIGHFLTGKCEEIDKILTDKQSQLATIQQHKKSLIYEYVTGKKRVKEAQKHGNQKRTAKRES